MTFIEGKFFTIGEELDHLRKTLYRFDLHRILMRFIEWELFHDKRRNLTVYERLLIELFSPSPDGIY
jgi:hypothetical protein